MKPMYYRFLESVQHFFEVSELAQNISKKRGLDLEVESLDTISPVHMSDQIQSIIQTTIETHQLSYRHMPSGAGHDAMNLARYVPTGMIFVPSLDGKSHSPKEWTALSDCLNGIKILTDTLSTLANRLD